MKKKHKPWSIKTVILIIISIMAISQLTLYHENTLPRETIYGCIKHIRISGGRGQDEITVATDNREWRLRTVSGSTILKYVKENNNRCYTFTFYNNPWEGLFIADYYQIDRVITKSGEIVSPITARENNE